MTNNEVTDNADFNSAKRWTAEADDTRENKNKNSRRLYAHVRAADYYFKYGRLASLFVIMLMLFWPLLAASRLLPNAKDAMSGNSAVWVVAYYGSDYFND